MTLRVEHGGLGADTYEVDEDGTRLTTVTRTWRRRRFDLDGRSYLVHRPAFARRYDMVEQPGPHRRRPLPVATATRIGSPVWTIGTRRERWHFDCLDAAGSEHLLRGDPAGEIRAVGSWRAVAELPGLPRHLQILAVLVALGPWPATASPE